MFSGDRKKLRLFVIKLRDKLVENADRYPTETKKIRYRISRFKKNAACIINPFYRNGTFNSFKRFIIFFERIYDDANREHTAATKFENLRQKNREFISFYSEFLGFVGKLDWNESAKIAALRRTLLNKIRTQLIKKDLPKNLF